MISQKLADILGIQVGDSVQVEVLEGKRPIRQVPVTGTLQDFTGVSAYMDIDALGRMMRDGLLVTGANLQVDPKMQDALYQELRTVPMVAGVTVKQHAIDSFENTVGENMMMKRIKVHPTKAYLV